MKIAIVYLAITDAQYRPDKRAPLDALYKGAIASGLDVTAVWNRSDFNQSYDLAVLPGYSSFGTERWNIIQHLTDCGTKCIFTDSNVLNYNLKDDSWHRYWLYSAIYSLGLPITRYSPDKDLWAEYSQWHNVTCKPWRTSGEHILILCQRLGGWNWPNGQRKLIKRILDNIYCQTDRSIIVRLHPGDRRSDELRAQIRDENFWYTNIGFSETPSLLEDLHDCWTTIGINSTPNAVAAIEGIPPLLIDPNHSISKEVGYTNFSSVEAPPTPERYTWLQWVASLHWHIDDVKEGHLLRRIISLIED